MANEELHPTGLDHGSGGLGVDDGSIPEGRTPTKLSEAARNAKAATNAPPAKRDVIKEYGEQKKAEKAAAEQTRLAALSPLERKRHELMRHPAYYDSKHPDHQKVVAQMRQVLAGQTPPDEVAKANEAPILEQREGFGIELEFIAPQYREDWNETDEGSFYAFARQEGMEPSLVKTLVADYVREAQMNDGKVTDEMVDRFHKRYAHRMDQRTRDALVKWIRSAT